MKTSERVQGAILRLPSRSLRCFYRSSFELRFCPAFNCEGYDPLRQPPERVITGEALFPEARLVRLSGSIQTPFRTRLALTAPALKEP